MDLPASLARHSIVLDKTLLYHGSVAEGLDVFEPAQQCTIGYGLYCTSARSAAIGYAVKRAGELDIDFNREFKVPTLYTVAASGTFLDLRQGDCVLQLLPQWRTRLLSITHTPDRFVGQLETLYNAPDAQQSSWNSLERQLQRQSLIALETVQRHLDHPDPQYATSHAFVDGGGVINGAFTQFIREHGYDGVIGMETEGKATGPHDSYVVFDPLSVQKIGEENVGNPVAWRSLLEEVRRKREAFRQVVLGLNPAKLEFRQ